MQGVWHSPNTLPIMVLGQNCRIITRQPPPIHHRRRVIFGDLNQKIWICIKTYLHLIWHNPSMPKYPSESTGGQNLKFQITFDRACDDIRLEIQSRKFLRKSNLNLIRNRNTLWKSPTCRKSPSSFITWCCIEYTLLSAVFEPTTLGTDCTCSCKSNYRTITTTTTPIWHLD